MMYLRRKALPGKGWRRWRATAAPPRVVLAAALALCLSPPSLAERTIEDEVYSRAQAREGKKLYDEHCIACHERGYFREVLRTRRGETLTPIFDVMVTEMPQNAPGSLRDEEYVDVIAYMLSQSRYADGRKPLRVSDLGDIRIPAGE
jgi:mono/diheme cytochrome c family protein